MFRMVFIILDRVRNGKTYSVDSDSFSDFVDTKNLLGDIYIPELLELTGFFSIN